MKVLSVILSFVILSMNIVPCADGVSEHSHDEIAVHDHADDAGHDKHSHEDSSDDCAPFCSCTCCGVSITAPDLNLYEIVNPDQTFNYSFHYSINYNYSFSEGIWHPPTV